MKYIILILALTLSAQAEYTIRDGVVTHLSTAANPNAPTAAESDALFAELATAQAAAAAKEAERLAKRPKRSEINALKAKANNDNSNSETKETVKLLLDMMTRIIEFQKVDVEEDVE